MLRFHPSPFKLHPSSGHPEWPVGLDLCPDFLYLQLTGKRPEQVFPAWKDIPVYA